MIIIQNRVVELYPKCSIALRTLITMPVTVASAERSFSKLKLIKLYLRATISQERFVGLSFISIENKIIKSLDIENIIDKFAAIKTRKVAL